MSGTVPPVSSSRGRLPALDIARVAAVFSVVGIHALAPTSADTLGARALLDVARVLLWWSLPTLFMISGFLEGRRKGDHEGGRALGRVRRLLPPYLVATVAYVVYAQAKRSLGAQTTPEPLWDLTVGLLTGSAASHLWFIPVLLESGVISWWARRVRLPRIALIAVALVLSLAFIGMQAVAGVAPEVLRTLYRTPMYWLLFYVMGCYWGEGGRAAPRFVAFGAIGLGVLTSALPVLLVGAPDVVVGAAEWVGPGILAVGIFLLATGWTRTATYRLVRQISDASLYVYLVHFALVDALLVLGEELLGLRVGPGYGAAVWLLGYATSLTIVLIASRGVPVARHRVGGL